MDENWGYPYFRKKKICFPAKRYGDQHAPHWREWPACAPAVIANLRGCTNIGESTCMGIDQYKQICICIYYTYLYTYVCTCICICIYIHSYIVYIHIYILVFVFLWKWQTNGKGFVQSSVFCSIPLSSPTCIPKHPWSQPVMTLEPPNISHETRWVTSHSFPDTLSSGFNHPPIWK